MKEQFTIKRQIASSHNHRLQKDLTITHPFKYEVTRSPGVTSVMISAISDYQPGQSVNLDFMFLANGMVLDLTPAVVKQPDDILRFIDIKGDMVVEVTRIGPHQGIGTLTGLTDIEGILRYIDPQSEFTDSLTGETVDDEFLEGIINDNPLLKITTYIPEHTLAPGMRHDFKRLAELQPSYSGYICRDPRMEHDVPYTKAYNERVYAAHRLGMNFK